MQILRGPPAPLYKLYLLNRQHEQRHVTQTAPSGQRQVRACVCVEGVASRTREVLDVWRNVTMLAVHLNFFQRE